MQPKHKERWSVEIKIMLRLDHPNVIQALEVPTALLAVQEAHDPPMLAMEYCSEGDLRNVSSWQFNRPVFMFSSLFMLRVACFDKGMHVCNIAV